MKLYAFLRGRRDNELRRIQGLSNDYCLFVSFANRSHPRVTIGIPVRNQAHTIGETIRAIKSQTMTSFVVSISDNGSTDNTVAEAIGEIGDDSRFAITLLNTNVGFLMNYRSVLLTADTEYFMWLAGDDLIASNYLEILCGILDDHSNAVLACSSVELFDARVDGVNAAYQKIDYSSFFIPKRSFSSLLRRRFIKPSYNHFYGVHRTRQLQRFAWEKHCPPIATEEPLLSYLAMQGDFVGTDETRFYRRISRSEGKNHKSWLKSEQSSLDRRRWRMRFFWLSWFDAKAASVGISSNKSAVLVLTVAIFIIIYIPLKASLISASLRRLITLRST